MSIQTRKTLLNNITKQAMLDKIAEEAIDIVDNDLNTEEDYGHKIFQELLKNIKIKGFEDLD